MDELIVLLVKLLPEDKILSDLKEFLLLYEITKSEDAKHKIAFGAMMVAIRFGDEKQSASDCIKELIKKKHILETFENREQ